jgi:hypothetical protein
MLETDKLAVLAGRLTDLWNYGNQWKGGLR